MTLNRRSFFSLLAGAACSVLGAVYGVSGDYDLSGRSGAERVDICSVLREVYLPCMRAAMSRPSVFLQRLEGMSKSQSRNLRPVLI